MNVRWMAVLFLSAFLFSCPAFADPASTKRQTVLNNTTDFLATVGKSPQDKKEILEERREIRQHVRSKDQERRKRAAIHKRMKDQEAAVMRKIQATQ